MLQFATREATSRLYQLFSQVERDCSEERRRGQYVLALPTNDKTYKETRLFGLVPIFYRHLPIGGFGQLFEHTLFLSNLFGFLDRLPAQKRNFDIQEIDLEDSHLASLFDGANG